MVTSAAAQTTSHRRQLQITASALLNWREKVKHHSDMSDEKLGDLINDMVSKSMKMGKFRPVLDDGEPAKCVQLGETDSELKGDGLFYALVKKSIANPDELAVVTIMTPAYVDKKMQTQWSTNFSLNGMSDENKAKISSVKVTDKPMDKKVVANEPPRRPTPVPVPTVQAERKTFLLSYILPRPNQGESTRQYEEWNTAEEIETRLLTLKVVPGTVRVYREMAVGYRIIDEKR